MKKDSDNFRSSATVRIVRRLREKGAALVIYEPSAGSDVVEGIRVVRDLSEFKRVSDVIVANRFDGQLEDVRDKVYTRDLFQCG